jgi:hypothetical protein
VHMVFVSFPIARSLSVPKGRPEGLTHPLGGPRTQ